MVAETREMMELLDERLRVKDEEGRTVLQVALLATVYFEEPYRNEARQAVVASCESYLDRCRPYLRWALNPDTEYMDLFGKGKGSHPRGWLLDLSEEDGYSVICHGAEYERGASAISLRALGSEKRPYPQLGYLQMSFPLLWFASAGESPSDVVLEVCQRLVPLSGYAGIGVVESPDTSIRSLYAPIVYQWAQRFPGLEPDYPISHSIWLLDGRKAQYGGIKGVNWLTVVDDRLLAELGGRVEVERRIKELDPRFVVHHFESGVMIQAGPHPELGDAERGVWPELYVKLAKYLKPIRITEHRPFQYDGPGIRFDLERSEAWLRRFDDR